MGGGRSVKGIQGGMPGEPSDRWVGAGHSGSQSPHMDLRFSLK